MGKDTTYTKKVKRRRQYQKRRKLRLKEAREQAAKGKKKAS